MSASSSGDAIDILHVFVSPGPRMDASQREEVGIAMRFVLDGRDSGPIHAPCNLEELKTLVEETRLNIRNALAACQQPDTATTTKLFEHRLRELGNHFAMRLLGEQGLDTFASWLLRAKVLVVIGELGELIPWEVLYLAGSGLDWFVADRALVARPAKGLPRTGDGAFVPRVVHAKPAVCVLHSSLRAYFNIENGSSHCEANGVIYRVLMDHSELINLFGVGKEAERRCVAVVTHGNESEPGLRLVDNQVLRGVDLRVHRLPEQSFVVLCSCEFHDPVMPQAMVHYSRATVLSAVSVLPTGDGVNLAKIALRTLPQGLPDCEEMLSLIEFQSRFVRAGAPLSRLFMLHGDWDLMIRSPGVEENPCEIRVVGSGSGEGAGSVSGSAAEGTAG